MLFSLLPCVTLLLANSGAAFAQTATVDAAISRGTPANLASGWIYGIPDQQGQIADHFYTDVGYRYGRAGGAQLVNPGERGWIWGVNEYKSRFQSALSNYQTSRKYGARFQLLLHDLWGADGTQNSSAPYPGDNGNWAFYDAFLTQVIADIKSNSMEAGLDIDLWNEPEGIYWTNRGVSQWVNMWGRGFHRLRDALGPAVLLVGPSLALPPATGNSWWNGFLGFIGANNSIPDQYTWHLECGSGCDLQMSNSTLKSMLSSHGLPDRPNNVNEYGTGSEQVPSSDAWYISRFERYDTLGLRGNWGSTTALHDFLAGLVGKPNAGTSSYSATAGGYWPTGEFQVYKYYHLNQTGIRLGTTGSADGAFDVYATKTGSVVRILCGSRAKTGTWDITVTNLASLGLPSSGSITITTYEFPWTSQFGEVDSPVNLGQVTHTYTGNSVTWWVNFSSRNTAYAFEFAY
ncbi:hypothetical protein CNMCM5623_002851 [Aspergillus felis]|uniref:Glycoside hydrolase family 39 protein n=1 Tax=Aspergillus felis TaxID=1287682 RepID=A0A8H6R0M8_9EURO|nr:hypothetical protein CNMCM5623_002851 [Aspergillus felis]KAF7182576.1 hypothetical protein CNMCM7691_002147 [Aspergillus felis]